MGSGARPSIRYQGSKRRLRRIRFRDNWNLDMWIVLVVAVLYLLFVLPWLADALD